MKDHTDGSPVIVNSFMLKYIVTHLFAHFITYVLVYLFEK